MKEFKQISREESIKKIVDYFNNHNFKNVGIVFEKQKDATTFLDEVKNLLNKEDSVIWNKTQIESKNKVRVLTDNCRNPSRILSGWTCEKLFIEQKCFEKYSKDIHNGCICPQCALKSEEVENYLIKE